MDAKLGAAIARLGVGKYIPGSSAQRGCLYNPLPFPGCNVKCHRPNSPKRWSLITKHTNFRSKRVLDFGCATGYFSFMAAQAGASYVLGVDYDASAIGVCKEATRAFKVQNVEFIVGSDVPVSEKYDVGFAMAILNWLGKDRAEKWLANTCVKTLFVEIPVLGDGRGGADWVRNDVEIALWLKGFRASVEIIGSSRAPHNGKWRSLFLC